MKGFLLAAPHSGAGKTLLAMVILRYFKQMGVSFAPVKAGPDYIDPVFHRLACGEVSYNLDPWAMRPDFLRATAARVCAGGKSLIVEAMMGLFDGALDGSGTPADLARILGLPIMLIVDCSKMSHSVAALVSGFHNFAQNLALSGLILNKVGSLRHERILRKSLEKLTIPVLGVIYRDDALILPERHLGLALPDNIPQFENFIARASSLVAPQINWPALETIAASGSAGKTVGNAMVCPAPAPFSPLGKNIAVARDEAFCFLYPHLLAGWQNAGSRIHFFSPLADEAPPEEADSVYLPGGYPELYGEQLAAKHYFKAGMRDAAADHKVIYGECGGFMVLGEKLEDKGGQNHAMLGLLPLATSIKVPRLHLGYRQLQNISKFPLPQNLRGHEFHYGTIIYQEDIQALFQMNDALGENLGTTGLVHGHIAGSFLHAIDSR